MKIVIPGGSGQVGTILARALHGDGHEVVVLSRQPAVRPWRTVHWDGQATGESFDEARCQAVWCREIDGSDVVINLAGRSVNCRYTARNRAEILHSRVASTQAIGQAIAEARFPPRLWLQASTATIYAHRFDASNDEITGRIGGSEPDAPPHWKFSIDVAQAWESALASPSLPHTRRIALRSAMTMSPDPGGIFNTLLTLVKCGLGGPAGNGLQYVSWIHHEDFVRAIHWLVHREDIDGVVNLSAPHPLPFAEFMQALRKAAGIPIGLPATRWMLELGAVFLRTETELILKSRRVVPRRLLESGFVFQHPEWPNAARDLCR